MEEILTIRVPKGTRRRLEKLARAEALTLSQYVRRAIDTERLLTRFGQIDAVGDAAPPRRPSGRMRGQSRGRA